MAVTDNAPIKESYSLIASILVEALFFGDKKTAERYNITQRSIRNYRKILENDPGLSTHFQLKKEQFEQNWAEEIPAAIRAGMRFIFRAANEANHNDPEVIHAVAGAIKLIAEIGLTKDIIDAKLGKYIIPDRTQD